MRENHLRIAIRDAALSLSSSGGVLWTAVQDGMGRDLQRLDAQVAAGQIEPAEVFAALERFGPADLIRWIRDPAPTHVSPKHLVKHANRAASRLLRSWLPVLQDGMRGEISRLEIASGHELSGSEIDAALHRVGLADLTRWFGEGRTGSTPC